MISKYEHGRNIWVDVENPTHAELAEIKDLFLLPSQLVSIASEKSSKPFFDRFNDIYFLKLHFPVFDKSKNQKNEKEVNFILGKNFIITTHRDPIEQMSEINKTFEINSVLNKQNPYEIHIGGYFYEIIKKIHNELVYHLQEIETRIQNIEKNIMHSKTYMIKIMSNISYAILDFKENIKLNREIFRLYRENNHLSDDSDRYYISIIVSEYNKAESILDNLELKLNDLRRTTDSLISDNTNKTIKILTTMSFIIFSLTLIVGIIGINPNLVHISSLKDLTVVIFGMGLIAVIMYIYFKDRKWL